MRRQLKKLFGKQGGYTMLELLVVIIILIILIVLILFH